MRIVCFLILILGLAFDSFGKEPDPIPEILIDVQARQGLEIPRSDVLVNRSWQDPKVRESLGQYITARDSIRRQDTAVAISLLSRATQLDRNNAAAWRKLAMIWDQQGQRQIAMQAWRQVFRINPDDLDALHAIGMSVFRDGDVSEAARLLTAWRINDGQQLLRQTRPDRVLYAEGALAHCMDVLGERQAGEALRRSIRRDIEGLRQGSAGMVIRLDLWNQIIDQLKAVSAYESAFDATATILPLVRNDADELKNWYRDLIGHAILFDDGSRISTIVADIDDEAILMLAPGMSSRQIRAGLLYEAAALFSNLGSQDAAAWLYEDVLEYTPSNVMARNNLGYHLLEQNRVDDYLARLIESVWRDAPDDPAVLDTYGWMQYLKGRFSDEENLPGAASLLKEANDRSSDAPSPEILDHLGDTYYRLGDLDAAEDVWSQALSIIESQEQRAQWILSSMQLQQGLWGRRLRDPGTLYDLAFGELRLLLEKKLTALETGAPCEVRPTFSELEIQY